MAAGPAPSTPNTPAGSHTSISKPYDPMKTVDGMFKGCVMRMAYAFKDPKSFGESTKLIISECTKKYQDALDDCDIQILDAKWYLEQKLAENKARREEKALAKAKEASAATAKRKHQEAAEKDQSMNVESPPKRTKANEQPSPRSSSAVQNLSSAKDQAKVTNAQQSTPSQQTTKPMPQPSKPQQLTIKTEEKKPTTSQPPLPSQAQKSDPPVSTKPEPNPAPTPVDEFPKPTPNVTPGMMNDDFTFESMFNDALGDEDDNIKDDLDIGLDDDPFGDDFGSDPFANDPSMTTQSQSQAQPHAQKKPPAQSQPSQNQEQNMNTNTDPATENAFSALLEGVEHFANQPDDSQRPLSSALHNNNSSTTTNTFTGDMEMGTNIFDSFLNDEFDVGSNHGGDFGAYGNGGDGDVNFDELFGDGT